MADFDRLDRRIPETYGPLTQQVLLNLAITGALGGAEVTIAVLNEARRINSEYDRWVLEQIAEGEEE